MGYFLEGGRVGEDVFACWQLPCVLVLVRGCGVVE
jgi:hypothetical protein